MVGVHSGGSCSPLGGQEASGKRWSHTISLESNDIKSPIRSHHLEFSASFQFHQAMDQAFNTWSFGENLLKL